MNEAFLIAGTTVITTLVTYNVLNIYFRIKNTEKRLNIIDKKIENLEEFRFKIYDKNLLFNDKRHWDNIEDSDEDEIDDIDDEEEDEVD